MTSFTFIDVFVGVVLVISAGLAFLRGFVHEVLAIGAWVGAVAVTLYGFDPLEPWFAAQVGPGWAATLLTGASLFLITLLTCSLLTKAIANQVRNSALNSVDSSLGFAFGLARGALIVSAVYYMGVEWAFDSSDLPQWLSGAKTRPWLERGAGEIRRLRPHNWGSDTLLTAQQMVTPARGDLEQDSKRGAAELAAPPAAAASAQALAAPKPDSKPNGTEAAKPRTAGYDKDERREMDRLFHNNQ